MARRIQVKSGVKAPCPSLYRQASRAKYRPVQSLSIKRIGEHTYPATTNYADMDRLAAMR